VRGKNAPKFLLSPFKASFVADFDKSSLHPFFLPSFPPLLPTYLACSIESTSDPVHLLRQRLTESEGLRPIFTGVILYKRGRMLGEVRG